eukprot:gene22527-65650_t
MLKGKLRLKGHGTKRGAAAAAAATTGASGGRAAGAAGAAGDDRRRMAARVAEAEADPSCSPDERARRTADSQTRGRLLRRRGQGSAREGGVLVS